MGFSFGAPAENAPVPATGGGFSFGGAPAAGGAAASAPAAGGGFSFGGAAAPAAAAPATGGGLFGAAPAAATAAAPAAGGFGFGGAAPAAPTPAPAAAAAAAPAAGGFAFGTDASKPAASSSSAPAPAAGGGFSFGGAAPAAAAPAAAAPAASAPSAGGFNFGGGASTASAATTAPASNETEAKAPAAAAPAAGGFGFGGLGAAATTDAATATPAAKTGFGFGGATPGTTPAAKAPSPVKTPQTAGGATPAPAAGGGLFGGTPAAGAAATTPAASSTTTTTAAQSATAAAPQAIEPPPIEYQSLTIEQILNRFQSELETDAVSFLAEAQRVSHYDATLRDSQHSLGELTNMVSRLMLHQNEVDTQLKGIGSYQSELGGTLDLLERNVDELFAAQSNVSVEDADVERERGYERAIDVDSKLDRMNVALNGVVSDLNAAQERVWSSSSNGGREDGKDEEVGKIIGVFNAHHETLAYLEGKARAVEEDMAMIGQVLAEEYSLQRILGPETGTIPGYMHLIQEPSPSNLQLKQLQL